MPVINIEELEIEVELKNVKNINLRIYPPDGRVKISAPRRQNIDAVEKLSRSKLDWIRRRDDVARRSL